jgi:uncharacterized protein (DUF1697 family)
MPAVIAMLRGINLGNRRVKMDDLRAVYESLGFANVRTYVQSGNVVFEAKERDLPRLATQIEKAQERTFGFQADTILRTADDLRGVISRNPFAKRKDIVPGKLLVAFLEAVPDAAARKKFLEIKADPEEMFLDGRELYIYFPNGQARPKLNVPQVYKTLNTRWTGRNWNTVEALLEMALNPPQAAADSPSAPKRRAR